MLNRHQRSHSSKSRDQEFKVNSNMLMNIKKLLANFKKMFKGNVIFVRMICVLKSPLFLFVISTEKVHLIHTKMRVIHRRI